MVRSLFVLFDYLLTTYLNLLIIRIMYKNLF